MEIAFDAIGLEILTEKALNGLVKDAEKLGVASLLIRRAGILHGRCWRIGEGIEVWTVLYECQSGEVFSADCRPAFRARFRQRLNPWVLTEFDEAGEALIHGFIEDTETEVLFELQNLTEVCAKNFQQDTLTIGLCGLAYRAAVVEKGGKFWRSSAEDLNNINRAENDWSLCGEIISFSALQNPFSGCDLFWLHLDLGDFELEILVNQKTLLGENLYVGATIKADIWLQGHILREPTVYSGYEGVDFTWRNVEFWRHLKKVN